MRGWGNGISSSSHCCKVFSVHRQDVSQTATVLKSFMSISKQWSAAYLWLHMQPVRCWTWGVSTSATTPALVAAFLWAEACLSVCQWDVWCTLWHFCDGWLQCFSNQEWGSGRMLMGIQMGGVAAYFSNPALAWQTQGELNPPKSSRAMFYLLSYRPQLYFCRWQRQNHICFTDQQTTRNKRRKSWHTSRCQNLCVSQCLVYRHLCSTTVKHLHGQPNESYFSPAITIETYFIYEILSKDVGKESSWQILGNTSVCLWQWKTFLMLKQTERLFESSVFWLTVFPFNLQKTVLCVFIMLLIVNGKLCYMLCPRLVHVVLCRTFLWLQHGLALS